MGIEPTHEGFADLSLTAWVPRLGKQYSESALAFRFCRRVLVFAIRAQLLFRDSHLPQNKREVECSLVQRVVPA